MKRNLLLSISILVIYFIVDAGYQVAFGMNFAYAQYEAAGIKDIYSTTLNYPIFMLAFFIMITLANLVLAVHPALEKKSVGLAVRNGVILGFTAYGNLAFVNTWSINNFPLWVTAEMVLEGILFSPIASGVTAWWALKKES